VQVEVRIFQSWPAHAALEWDVRQTSIRMSEESRRERAKKNAPEAHRMTPDEFAAFLGAVQRERGEQATLASARVLASSGRPVVIRIGSDDEQAAEPESGMRFEITPRVNDDRSVTFSAAYHEYGVDSRPPASEYEGGDEIRAAFDSLTLEPGHTQFQLAHGLIGAPMRLVAVTVKPVE